MRQTILLVDDDEVLGRVLSRVLERRGYTVARATGAAQALQEAKDHPPRLALLDLCLPDGDGITLGRQLRELAPDLPLVLLTAFPLRLRDRPELTQNFQQVLTKPLDLAEFLGAVELSVGSLCG
jgi:CheY-like chemotaxis protein